jgi:hypothetical protein
MAQYNQGNPDFSHRNTLGVNEALAKVSNVHLPQPLLSPASLREAGRAREGNTPLHPSQEGIYLLLLRETRVRVGLNYYEII